MATPPTFTDWLAQRSTTWMLQPLSSAWYGITLEITGNEAVDGWLTAARMHLLDDTESPDDVLPLLAQDRKLPRYPLETAAQHRARLMDAWAIYDIEGTEAVIETQLRGAGYGPTTLIGEYGNPDVAYGDPQFFYGDLGAYVEFRTLEPGPRGESAPYRTQFWVVFNEGFHPVTGPPKPWGTWTWGDTWIDVPGVWAPTGLTVDFYRTVMGIVMKWKPSDHVFRGFTFVVSDVPYGDTGVTYGDSTVMYGGSINVDVPLGSTIP